MCLMDLHAVSIRLWKPHSQAHLPFALRMSTLINFKIISATCYLIGTAIALHCEGFRQSVDIPQDYLRDVPDALLTGQATDVKVEFRVRQLGRVIERRLI